MSAPVPPGIDADTLAAALDGFRSAVGTANVFADDADRASYLDPFDIGDPERHAPAAAVAPANTDELAAVLAVANRYRVPMWPVSMGKNFAYGTAAPALKGSIVLDLKRLNRVIELNEELAYVVVEPGVSFFDLKAKLDESKSDLWMSGPSHSWGSVIGNALEHGVGYTAYGQHVEQICGIEVMLADGTLVRTGFGALRDSREWNANRWPFGPGLEGLFTQSNFGIVTKMGVWLMPQPAEMASFSLSVPRKNDLSALIDALRPLRLEDTINAPYTIANGWRQSTGGRIRADLWTGMGAIPQKVVDRTLREAGRGWWSVIGNLFDHRAGAMDSRIARIRDHLAHTLPDATIEFRHWERGQPLEPWQRQDVALSPLGIVDWRGSPGGHSDLGPVVAAIGSRVDKVYSQIEKRFLEYGIDPWVGMFGFNARSLIFVADMLYARDDPEMTASCRALFRTLCKDLQLMGVGLYRSHIEFMDDAKSMHDWNEGALPALNDRIKACLDPNNILAPGKQGIGSRTA